jgi:hypothetical protein
VPSIAISALVALGLCEGILVRATATPSRTGPVDAMGVADRVRMLVEYWQLYDVEFRTWELRAYVVPRNSRTLREPMNIHGPRRRVRPRMTFDRILESALP